MGLSFQVHLSEVPRIVTHPVIRLSPGLGRACTESQGLCGISCPGTRDSDRATSDFEPSQPRSITTSLSRDCPGAGRRRGSHGTRAYHEMALTVTVWRPTQSGGCFQRRA